MRPFVYELSSSVQNAASRAGTGSAFIAGGTTIIDLMKLEVMSPPQLVDLNPLPMRGIEMREDGLRIGALEKMSDCGRSSRGGGELSGDFPGASRECFPADSQYGEHRRKPVAANPLWLFPRREHALQQTGARERLPGDRWRKPDARDTRHQSFLCRDTSERSRSGLGRLDASIRLQNGAEERLMKLDEFYLLPGDTPDRENQLRPGELITEVRVPTLPWARRSAYLKIRDRESYEFALTSAAVALDVDGDKIRDVRLAVGGVGTKPWNLPKVREALAGKSYKPETFAAAAKLAASDATPLKHNGFKVELVAANHSSRAYEFRRFGMSTNIIGKPQRSAGWKIKSHRPGYLFGRSADRKTWPMAIS